MKKKITAVLAALMVMSLGTVTAFAATSPTTENTKAQDYKAAVSSVTVDGVAVEFAAVSDADMTAAEQEAAKHGTNDAVATVKAVIDVKGPATGGKATIAVPGVKAGANILVLHFVNGAWETITPDEVADGAVTATFTSFSPVVIVELAAKDGATETPAGTPAAQTTGSTGTVASPKTGESASVLAIIAVICLAGVAVCGKKVMAVSNR